MNNRQAYDTELSELSYSLIRMGAMAQSAIDRAIAALNTGDKALARQVIEEDNQIDDLDRGIEQRCLRLLLKQQPVAGDLRKISAAIKMITDIERIGDSAADIAEISLQLNDPVPPDVAADIEAMTAAARSMVEGAIDAYVKGDVELARRTRNKDDIVDDYFIKIRTALGQRMHADTAAMDEVIDYLLIIKYLERIGDHAENICDWVEFYKTGIHKNERII